MSKKIGLSKTRPVNEATPLGTPRPRATLRQPARLLTKNVVDITPAPVVDSSQSAIPPTHSVEHSMIDLTLKARSKNGKAAYYTGAAQVLRFPIGAFVDKVAPQTDPFAHLAVAKAKAPKMTKDERKAYRLANPKPKPTLAEQAARLRKKLAALEAKQEPVGATM